MEKIVISLSVFCLLLFSSCNKDSGDSAETLAPITINITVNGTGTITEPITRYYSLETGQEVQQSGNWDIAFRRAEIYLNGGTSGNKNVLGQRLAESVTFEGLAEAPKKGYLKDGEFPETDLVSETMNNKVFANWYSYNEVIISNQVVYAIKTVNSKYVKLQILTYTAGTYTFKYTIQPGGSRTFIL